jgi:hypothetical protein
MKSAAGDARTPTPHAAATSAETPSDIETETSADFKENETGLFKAFERARTRKVLQTFAPVEIAGDKNILQCGGQC